MLTIVGRDLLGDENGPQISCIENLYITSLIFIYIYINPVIYFYYVKFTFHFFSPHLLLFSDYPSRSYKKSPRYPKRKISKVCYTEDYASSDDDFLCKLQLFHNFNYILSKLATIIYSIDFY